MVDVVLIISALVASGVTLEWLANGQTPMNAEDEASAALNVSRAEPAADFQCGNAS